MQPLIDQVPGHHRPDKRPENRQGTGRVRPRFHPSAPGELQLPQASPPD